MNKEARLKKYHELFKKNLMKYLADNISVKAIIYPVQGAGAVFEYVFNDIGDNSETVSLTSSTIGSVLKKVPQRFLSGNLDNARFGGTNIFMEGNRLLLIKGEDTPSQWTGHAVKEDVIRVVSTSQGGTKVAP